MKEKAYKVFLTLLIIAVSAFCGWTTGEEYGYRAGYDSGYLQKESEAKKELADERLSYYNSGYNNGYNAGLSAGKNSSENGGSLVKIEDSESSPPSSYQTEPQSITVYITKTGNKYHKLGCQYLRQSKIAISLNDAKAKGYTACSKCW